MLSTIERLKKLSNSLGKISAKDAAEELYKLAAEVEEEEEAPEIKEYRTMLNKIKGKDSFKKLKIFIDNQRLRKPIRWWLTSIDDGEGAGEIEFLDFMKKIKIMIDRDLPAAKFLKLILDYGIANGYIALDRMLGKGRAKITLLKEEVK
jgi:hypothetical protein